MIRCENLVYEYPDKRALHDINFELKPGSITALVGPNGAGKSTLMRCLAGLDRPFSGNSFVMDINVQDNPRAAHEKLGYLSDFFGLYDDLTVRQCLTYIAWSHHIGAGKVAGIVNTAIDRLGLGPFADKKAGGLSRGWRQRLGIAQTILHDPKILILDEPASGLDPEARSSLSKLLIQLQQDGMTLLVSSHILAELEDYCTDMLVIRDGRIVEHVGLSDYQAESETVLLIKVASENDQTADLLKSLEGVQNVAFDKGVYSVAFKGDAYKQSAFLKEAINKDIAITSFTQKPKRLQDRYLEIADKQTIEIENQGL